MIEVARFVASLHLFALVALVEVAAFDLCVHTDAVVVHGNQYLLHHDLQRTVLGQCEVEEAGRGVRQLVIHLDLFSIFVLARMRLDPEDEIGVLKGCIAWWQSLLTPTEDHKVLAILLRDFLKELPEVLDKLAILLIIFLVLRIFSVSTQEWDIRLAAAADPRFKVVNSADVEHTLRYDLTKTSTYRLHLDLSLR